jgi:hypothetical protein
MATAKFPQDTCTTSPTPSPIPLPTLVPDDLDASTASSSTTPTLTDADPSDFAASDTWGNGGRYVIDGQGKRVPASAE